MDANERLSNSSLHLDTNVNKACFKKLKRKKYIFKVQNINI